MAQKFKKVAELEAAEGTEGKEEQLAALKTEMEGIDKEENVHEGALAILRQSQYELRSVPYMLATLACQEAPSSEIAKLPDWAQRIAERI